MKQIDFTKAKIRAEEKFLLINMSESEYIKYIYDEYYVKKHLSMDKISKIFGYGSHYYSNAFKEYDLPARSNSEKGKIYTCNKDFFETINTEEKAYWLGFMYADGYIQSKRKNGNKKIGLSLGIADIDHLNKFKNSLDSNCEIKTYKTCKGSYVEGTKYCRILVTEEKLAQDLINKGCVEHKTNVITFPSENIVPKNLQKHFIRGYFDGDGSIWCTTSNNKTIPSYSIDHCGTDEFLTGLMDILIKEEVIQREYKFDKRKEGQIVSRFRFGGNLLAKKFCEYIYSDATIYLERKYDRYQDLLKVLDSVKRINRCCVCGITESSEFCMWIHGGEYDGKILCGRHYRQLLKHGKIIKVEKNPVKDNKCCVCGDTKSTNYFVYLKDKESEYYGKTVCRRHYDQLYRLGNIKDKKQAKHKTK